MPHEDLAERLHSAAIHLLRRVATVDARAGLSPARHSALAVIVDRGPLTMTDLARIEQVSPATASSTVGGLEAADLVARRKRGGDARSVVVQATEAGRRVLAEGRVEQVGPPQEIYGNPQTRFVAQFVGTLNFLTWGPAAEALVAGLGIAGAEDWAVRPERLALAGPGEAGLAGTVTRYTYLGREAQVHVDTPVGNLVVQVADPGVTAASAAGDPVTLRIDPRALMAFGADGRRIGAGR